MNELAPTETLDSTQLSTAMSDQLTGLTAYFLPLTIFSIVLTILIIVAFLINAVRAYKVQKATLEMHKDIRAIKEHLLSRPTSARNTVTYTPAPANETSAHQTTNL